MLVLERKISKSVVIGSGEDQVNVKVLDVLFDPETGDHSVKLGFEAGTHICIDREEVRDVRVERIKGAISGSGC